MQVQLKDKNGREVFSVTGGPRKATAKQAQTLADAVSNVCDGLEMTRDSKGNVVFAVPARGRVGKTDGVKAAVEAAFSTL